MRKSKYKCYRPPFEIPKYPLHPEFLNCPQEYLRYSQNPAALPGTHDLDSQAILDLQEEIANHETWPTAISSAELAAMGGEEQKQALKLLRNYQEQWYRAQRIIDRLHFSSAVGKASEFGDFFYASDTFIYEQHVLMTQRYIDLLGVIITSSESFHIKRNQAQAYLLAANNHQASKLSDATIISKRKGHDQSKWKKKVVGAQESDETASETAWCPVLKDYIFKGRGTTAHIVSHYLGYRLAEKVFAYSGEGKDLLYDRRNGLWMATAVEKKLDDVKVIFVPTDTENLDFESGTYDLKLMVLDKTLLESKNNMILNVMQSNGKQKIYRWNDIHETTLNFRSADARPAKRYLYWRYLDTIARISDQKPSAFEDRLQTLGNMGRS